MAKIFFTGDTLVLKLEGAKKVLALKDTVKVPLRCIKSVTSDEVPFKLFYGLRRPGTHLPGVIVAGTFFTRGGKTFYYMRNRKKCITLHLKNHEYSQVIFEVEDKEKTAEQIRNRIQ